MTKHAVRKLALSLTLVVLTASAGKGIAQSTSTPTSSTSSPSIVTGTDPAPDFFGIILAGLGLA
jgi:hypothetical protein